MEFLFLSDEEYECLAKAIAVGVSLGVIIGLFFDYVIMGFSAGGISGVLLSLTCIYSKKITKKRKDKQ